MITLGNHWMRPRPSHFFMPPKYTFEVNQHLPMRDCASFDVLKTERISIVNAPYSATELNDLLNRYEKKLFHHLVDCRDCCLQDSRYCGDAFAIGSRYDAMLLVFDDAASKREALLNQVIRARISGRKVFVSLDYDHVPTPQQKPVTSN
jgi:hypothetical protein